MMDLLACVYVYDRWALADVCVAIFFAASGLGHVSIGGVCRIKQGVGEVDPCRLLEWER